MSNKWEVTFKFDRFDSKPILVIAPTAELAVDFARERDFPPVPQYIKAKVVKLGRGGLRVGAGPKNGSSRVKVKRNVQKSIQWTAKEWSEVEKRAKKQKLTVADYQRMKIFS